MIYKSWESVPAAQWKWENFTPQELACKGTGELRVNRDAMDRLQRLRKAMGHPLIVVSGYRSESHNRRVGGAKNSMHLQGRAFDISTVNVDPQTLVDVARQVGFSGIGTYPKQGFVHLDTGPTRTWGEPFPERVTRFQPEPTARPVLSTGQGRATITGVVGIVAAAAPGLVEVAQHPLANVVPWIGAAVAAVAVAALVVAVILRAKDSSDA
jgi:zinc D-Ala-D-Ala carboxypeptidase